MGGTREVPSEGVVDGVLGVIPRRSCWMKVFFQKELLELSQKQKNSWQKELLNAAQKELLDES